MRSRQRIPRSSSVESLSDKFKSWNSSLSNLQLRASVALKPVQEGQEGLPTNNAFTKSTPTLIDCAQDSVIDLGEYRDGYTGGDLPLGERPEHSQRYGTGSRDRSRSRMRLSARGSTDSESSENEMLFLQRIEKTRNGHSAHAPAATLQPDRKRTMRHARSMSRMTMRTEKSLPPLPEVQAQSPVKKTFMESVRSTRYLRNMRSLPQIKPYVNPHESMDFKCVGSPSEAVSAVEHAFEEREIQSEKDELARSINLTRARMCDQRIEVLERSVHLDREASKAASEIDEFLSLPAGSTMTVDEVTGTAELVGPAGYSGLATGERWASLQYHGMGGGSDVDGSRKRFSRSASRPSSRQSNRPPSRQHESSQASHAKPVLKLNTKFASSPVGTLDNMFTAITGDRWRSIGMARTAVDRRWVVVLSGASSLISDNDDTRSIRSLLTPSSSVRTPWSRSKSRGMATRREPSTPASAFGMMMTPSYSDDDEEDEYGMPGTPSISVTPIFAPDGAGFLGARNMGERMPLARRNTRTGQRLETALSPSVREDDDCSPMTPML